MLVRPSDWLGAEGQRDAKSCRGTRVATSSPMRPIATDAQLQRGRSIHAAYCYWGYDRTAWPTYRQSLAFLVYVNTIYNRFSLLFSIPIISVSHIIQSTILDNLKCQFSVTEKFCHYRKVTTVTAMVVTMATE